MKLKNALVLTLDDDTVVTGFKEVERREDETLGVSAPVDKDNNVLISLDAFMDALKKHILKAIEEAL